MNYNFKFFFYIHFNFIFIINKSLKEEVSSARRERVIFDNVFKNLELDLKSKEEEYKKHLFETL